MYSMDPAVVLEGRRRVLGRDAYTVLGGAPNVCPPSEAAEKVARLFSR